MKTMNPFYLTLIICLVVISSSVVNAQYTLENAISDAMLNTEIRSLSALNSRIAGLKTRNLGKQYLPQLGITGQATYQSDVTELPVSLPNIEIESLSKDQYRVQGEVRQLIYDGGSISKAKGAVAAATALENSVLEINLDNIREKVIHTYFSILELEKQQELLGLKEESITQNLKTLEAAVANGIVLPSKQYELQAAKISIQQEQSKVNAYKIHLIKVLGLLTDKEITTDNDFILPGVKKQNVNPLSNLPEFRQLDLKKEVLATSYEVQKTKSNPKAFLFFNGGYGRPALNFLDNSFQPYYLFGVKVTWNIDNLYTKKTDNQLLLLELNKIEEQKTMLFERIDIEKEKLDTELRLIETLIAQDNEILDLRQKMKSTAESQFQNGTITANELLQFINDESEVMQRMELRKIQTIKQQYLLEHITGNYITN